MSEQKPKQKPTPPPPKPPTGRLVKGTRTEKPGGQKTKG